MNISRLTSDEATTLAVETLGLDPDLVALSSAEGIASSIRRAASFMCPTSPRQLISSVEKVLQPVCSDPDPIRVAIYEMVDLLIAAGDLLELRDEVDDRFVRLLYLGPPSYIERESGVYLLSGVRPYGVSLVDVELSHLVEYDGEARTIHLDPTEADERLSSVGLERVEREQWVRAPRAEPADQLIGRLALRLDAAHPSGEIEGLQILDPAASVRYYRGRWRSPEISDSGDFVARRPQEYGADLWCVVRTRNGAPLMMLEFPIDDPLVPARDEAWRMQMAMDAQRGEPQVYATHPVGDGSHMVVRFFSPIPGFAQRYLELIGVPLPEAPRCLFAFRVPNGAMLDLEQIMGGSLWMQPNPSERFDGA
jgi:hypothetical protein